MDKPTTNKFSPEVRSRAVRRDLAGLRLCGIRAKADSHSDARRTQIPTEAGQ